MVERRYQGKLSPSKRVPEKKGNLEEVEKDAIANFKQIQDEEIQKIRERYDARNSTNKKK